MKLHLVRRPDVLLACAITLLFALWPQIDLTVATWFYVPGSGFSAWRTWWVNVTYLIVARFWVLALLLFAFLLLSLLPRFRQPWRQRRTAAGYLLAVLLLGPGLLVNTVLKNHWGRPRPVHLEQFGGTTKFTPALQPSTRCATNCAFVSGHAAAAFYLMAGYWVTRQRRYLVAGIGFGLFVGFVRMAMGAHFLSDVLFAGLIVYACCIALAPLFFRSKLVVLPARTRCQHAPCLPD